MRRRRSSQDLVVVGFVGGGLRTVGPRGVVLRGRRRRGKDPVVVDLPLGHREPSSTYWYLSAAPELLALAATRQDTAWTAARS
jgi:hypothetical protein